MKKSQTQKRVKLLNVILDEMEKHEIFSEIVERKNDTEDQIQKSVFLRLESVLPKIISDIYGFPNSKSKSIVKNHFIWEKKVGKTVNNFSFFATNHRPDGLLTIDDLRIAFEIKKGDNGQALRSGIGQSVVYSTQFDFVLYFFVDMTPGRDIKSSRKGEREQYMVDSLWKNYNVKFFIV